jgi:hypothetical protein
MNKDRQPSKDDIARLIRGKPSTGRVGSRHIRHRLRNDEMRRLSVARSRGFLTITTTTRAALKNAWHLDRLAISQPCVFVEHTEGGYLLSGERNGTPISATVATLKAVEAFVHGIQS